MFTWIHFLLFAAPIIAQSTASCDPKNPLDPACCVQGNGITAFPNCHYVNDTIYKCASLSVSKGAPFVSCFCNQALLNSFYGYAYPTRILSSNKPNLPLMSEQRLCLGTPIEDVQVRSETDLWHSACDREITFTPTTPPISSIAATFNVDICHSISQPVRQRIAGQ
jgi:hypothetical protein